MNASRTIFGTLALLAVMFMALLPARAQPPPIPVFTLHSADTSAVAGSAVSVQGYGTAAFTVSGTFVGTLTFQASADNGTNYVNLTASNVSNGASATTATAPGIYVASIAGMTNVRAPITDYTSGSITVTVTAGTGGGAAGGSGGGGGGAITSVDLGTINDAAVTGDSPGTLNGHARGLTKTIEDVHDPLNHLFSVGVATAFDKTLDSMSTWTPAGGMAAGAFVSGAVLSGAYADGSLVTVGTLADAAVGDASGTANSHLRQIAKTLGANLPAPGQAAMAASVPVAIASNQSAITVAQATAANLNATVSGTVTANAGSGTMATAPQAATTGGATFDTYICTGAANQDSRNIKASAGTLYTMVAFNTNASVRYLKLYNTSSPTSASTMIAEFAIPGQSAGGANGFVVPLPPMGVAFGTAIGMRVTTGQAANDTGAVTSGDVVITDVFF